MKPILAAGVAHETWSARYEQLRAGWLVHELAWGQALFVRQGMAAWMKAWPAAELSDSALRPDSIGPERNSAPSVTLGSELQGRLAREFVNLILHRQQEVLA